MLWGIGSRATPFDFPIFWILDFETKAMDQYRGVFANEADDGSLTVFKIPDQAPIDKYIRQVKSHKPVDGSYHSELNALIHIQKARNTLAILSQLPKIKNSWLITQYDILNKLLKLMRTKLKGSHMLEVRRGTLSNISVKDFTKGLIPVTTQKGFHSLLGKWITKINTKITTLRLRLRR